ncbi:MAG: hypothetical protein ACFFB0_16385 [Promethearchaeota archaeon]
MGVKLQDIIIRKKIDLKTLAGSIIAIDAPNIIMSLFNFARKNPDGSYADLILDRTQRPISHLYGLLYRINFYYAKNIFPIFCFDGKVSELKKLVTTDRLHDSQFYHKWYTSAISRGDRELAKRIALSKGYLWHNIIKESKELLGALGVPYIDSPASAESQCAYLVKQKIATYSNSQDFDSLLFGCSHMIQNLSKSLKRKVQGRWQYQKIEPFKIELKKNLDNLDITYFHLVDLGILIGTDYFPGIKGIGLKKALILIKKYDTIEKIAFYERHKYDFSKLSTELLNKIRGIFLFPDVNEEIRELYWNVPNNSKVLTLLCADHHLNEDRVQNNLNKLISNFNSCRAYFTHLDSKSRSIQITLDKLL